MLRDIFLSVDRLQIIFLNLFFFETHVLCQVRASRSGRSNLNIRRGAAKFTHNLATSFLLELHIGDNKILQLRIRYTGTGHRRYTISKFYPIPEFMK